MHYLFVDESGTSGAPHETLSVVAGIRFSPEEVDSASMALEQTIDLLLPEQFKDGFIFHMADLMNDKKYRVGWADSDRLYFMQRVMQIPRIFGASISYCIIRRSMKLGNPENGIPHTVGQHSFAFNFCISAASRAFDRLGFSNGPIYVIAEDVPEMQNQLIHGFKIMQETPFIFAAEGLEPTEFEFNNGIKPEEKEYNLSNIYAPVHYANKEDNILLQIADACAYAIRRYFSETKYGDLLIESVLGQKPELSFYKSELSIMTFNFPKNTPEMIRYITEGASVTHLYLD